MFACFTVTYLLRRRQKKTNGAVAVVSDLILFPHWRPLLLVVFFTLCRGVSSCVCVWVVLCVCVRCVPSAYRRSVATRVVAKIYRPFLIRVWGLGR